MGYHYSASWHNKTSSLPSSSSPSLISTILPGREHSLRNGMVPFQQEVLCWILEKPRSLGIVVVPAWSLRLPVKLPNREDYTEACWLVGTVRWSNHGWGRCSAEGSSKGLCLSYLAVLGRLGKVKLVLLRSFVVERRRREMIHSADFHPTSSWKKPVYCLCVCDDVSVFVCWMSVFHFHSIHSEWKDALGVEGFAINFLPVVANIVWQVTKEVGEECFCVYWSIKLIWKNG